MLYSPDCRQILRWRANASATISSAAWASGGAAPSVLRSDTLRSRFFGCQTRFRPIPTTTASEARSNSIPHIFEPSCAKISLGHLRKTSTCGAICRMASYAATAVTKASPAGDGSVLRNRTITLAKRLPFGLSQIRPRRPRPPSCASARSHSPSGAPCAARIKRSAFVDPVSATSSKMGVRTAPSRHKPSRYQAQVSQNSPKVNSQRPKPHLSRREPYHHYRQSHLPHHQNT